MFEIRNFLEGGASALLFVFLFFSIAFLVGPSVSAQNENAVFQISPADFTVKNLPLKGEAYTIPKELAVWNGDDNERLVNFGVRVPSAEEVTSGYEPVPNENWVRPVPTSVTIEENSSATIQVSMNFPSWENLKNKKWEVWITAERQPMGDEEFIINYTSRMKMETAGPTGGPGGGVGGFPYLWILVIVIVIAVVAAVVWFWSRGRGKKKVQDRYVFTKLEVTYGRRREPRSSQFRF